MPKATLDFENSGEYRLIPVDSIQLDEVTDVRSRKADKNEQKKVGELVSSIEANGQLQPIVVRSNGQDGSYRIIIGRRRLAAGSIIQEKTGQPFSLRAMVVDMTDSESRRAAIHENLQRENFTAPELARLIADIRKRNQWETAANWSDLVAKELGVSRATVTEHYKLLSLPAELLRKGESGQMSAQSLLQFANVVEAKQDSVLKRAEELAEKEERTAAPKKPAPAPAPAKGKAPQKAAPVEEEKGKVKHKHVLAAAREQEALKEIKPRTRGELMAICDMVLDSADPYHPLIVDYFKTFRDRWATGKLGDRGILNKLDAIHEALSESPRGKKKTAA